MKDLDAKELDRLWTQAETCDKDVFSEFKSNVLLVSGKHYDKLESHTRGERGQLQNIDNKQKVRITKNWMQKITMKRKNGILSLSPDLKVYPANLNEAQDKKAAELYDSVLEFGKNRYKLNEKKEEWCDDFVDVSEVAVKVYWDPSKGDLRAYEQALDQQGQPLFKSPNGQTTTLPFTESVDPMTMAVSRIPHAPLEDKNKPIFSGDFCFSKIFPANIRRDPEAEDMNESHYLIIGTMMEKEKVEKMVDPKDPDFTAKISAIRQSSEENFKVFDHNTHQFVDSKGKVLVREHYYRPCMDYPTGYFYHAVKGAKIHQGELPFGVFPVAWRAFRKKQTTPRGTGLVKICRPWQVEINRASSQQILHQLVHGDDKVISGPGGKLTQEAIGPGVKSIKGFGVTQVIPGRTGEQFTQYIRDQVAEMFQVVDEDLSDEQDPQLEPVAMLYRSIRRNKRYGRDAREFQAFLKDVYWIYLRLAKHYYDDQWVIRAIGRNEAVNMAEFRDAEDLSVQVRLIESNEDSETLLGKYLTMQYVLQYVGKDLPKEVLGDVLTNLPFANSTQVFGSLTLDSKNVENDLLAMDRGEQRSAQPDDNHKLYIMKLTNRIKSPDFKMLDPQIQQNYLQKRDEHRKLEAEQGQQLLMAEQQFIPMGGDNLVKVDMYVMENGKQVRATVPSDALKWLIEKLKQQGMGQERLSNLATIDQAAIAQQITNNNGGMNGNGINPINNGQPTGNPALAGLGDGPLTQPGIPAGNKHGTTRPHLGG